MSDDVTVASTTDTAEQVAAALGATPAPETPAAPVADPAVTPTTSATAAPVTPAEPSKGKGSAEDRIGRLTWEKHKLASEAEALRLENERLKKGEPATPAAEAAPTAPAVFAEEVPDIDDYESVKDWAKAYDAYNKRRSEHAVQAAITVERQRVETSERSKGAETVVARHKSRLDEYRKSHPDFDTLAQQVMEEGVQVSGEIHAFVVQSEIGPAILHELAKDLNECRRISALPPHLQFAELGALQYRLKTANSANGNGSARPAEGGPASTVTNPPAQPATSAAPRAAAPPPPIAPLSGAGNVIAAKDPNEMTQEEYNDWRARGGGR